MRIIEIYAQLLALNVGKIIVNIAVVFSEYERIFRGVIAQLFSELFVFVKTLVLCTVTTRHTIGGQDPVQPVLVLDTVLYQNRKPFWFSRRSID